MKPNWFVAFPVTPGDWLPAVTQNTPEGFRVFHPADLHITIAFLGACGPEQAHTAWDVLVAQSHPPIEIQLGPLRAMGHPRHPSAYALTLAQGHEPTAQIMGQWRSAIGDALQIRLDERPPLPHITVARPKRKTRKDAKRLGETWMNQSNTVSAQVQLNRVALYTWHEDRQSQLFQIVEERPLSAP